MQNLTNCTGNCSNKSFNNTEPEIYNKLFAVGVFLTLYVIFVLFAVTGNGLVCWIVLTNRRMHDATNFLLVNLALSDLLLALATTFHVADFAVKDLNLGDVGCKFQINMVNIPYGASCLTVTFISFERYCAICRPMDLIDCVKERLKYIIPSIWLLAIAIYFPTLYFCGKNLKSEGDQLSCDCTYRWPSMKAKNIHGVGIVVVLYVIPFTVSLYFYSIVIRRLKQVIPGENQGNTAVVKSRQGVVRMVMVTLIVFFVAWTPYNILYLLKRLQVDYRSVYSYVWYPAFLIATIHCVCNPIIYCLLGSNFRKAFKSIICCKNCRVAVFIQEFLSSTPRPTTRSTRRVHTNEMQIET